jgi:hypothetical protein
MSVVKGLSVQELLKRGSIRDLDVARFRRAFYQDGAIDLDEAETLFAINDACPVQDAAWSGLFIEAVTDFIVNRQTPEGYVTHDNATWLIARISQDGRIDSKTELELLAAVIDKARWAPESLCLFAIDQVRRAVLTGSGPLRAGQSLAPGMINNAEVDLVRRVLLAFAGSGGIAITRGEAEVLFDIEESLGTDEVNAAWTELFVKAVANALMSISGYKLPSREDALRHKAFLDRRGDMAPAAVLTQMVRTSLADVWTFYGEQTREERAIAELERRRIEIITNEEITPIEADWLACRLARDRALSANERALIEYLRTESPCIGPALRDLVGKIGIAA